MERLKDIKGLDLTHDYYSFFPTILCHWVSSPVKLDYIRGVCLLNV